MIIKKMVFRFQLAIIFSLLASCSNIHEEIVINEGGSGNYSVYSDLIPMMKTMAAMGIGGEGKNEAEKQKLLEDMVWKDFKGKIDSTLDISSKLPDEMS